MLGAHGADKLERPDRLIFDLDPDPQITWKTVVDSAIKYASSSKSLGWKAS